METSTSEIATGLELADLEAILDAGVQLATAPIHLSSDLVGHFSEARPGWSWRQVVPTDSHDKPQLDRLRSLEASSAPGADALRAATTEVLEVMAALFGAEALGVRLTDATFPPCPRFHVDRVFARGVVTLVGRGSEYLLGHEVDRSKLGHGAGGLPDECSGLISEGSEPRALAAGLLCIFKGEAWPANAGRALVHRSPPADGNPRWVMTIDLLD